MFNWEWGQEGRISRWVNQTEGCMKKPYETLTMLQVSRKYNFKTCEYRYPTWVNEAASRHHSHEMKHSVSGTGHLPSTF